eukprot:CAMPEP_0205923666 /NCGR_PEP_ID=MMETSP1325-20131115/16529_1 /ASSEMBLY_ACC=CAM_ASM_000708 /TAXON_ID=236786 /ORGANISM="Florenciella sp., Strain RCC1007" /LENGTH=281 /DNA_ID=CAMNT_0053291915 /DNA_START=42 /DNA_END=887 /DNA_ORIENTATION=+
MSASLNNEQETLQAKNIARVQALVAEFQAGNPAGYLEGVHDNISGSVLGGLIPGGENYSGKEEFAAIMEKMPQFMEVKKFAPRGWHAVNDDVLFNVDWEFVWLPTGETIETTALVRKVVRDGMICEKYHCVCNVEEITGEPAPHDPLPVQRVQELLAEYGAGRPEGYLAGCSDNFSGSVLDGLIPGAIFSSKEGFGKLMGDMSQYMDVTRFEPCNFVAMPNNDMMMNVEWSFTWLPTGAVVDTTAIVRKVLDKDGNLCEKYHMVDSSCIMQESPRDVSFDL